MEQSTHDELEMQELDGERRIAVALEEIALQLGNIAHWIGQKDR